MNIISTVVSILISFSIPQYPSLAVCLRALYQVVGFLKFFFSYFFRNGGWLIETNMWTGKTFNEMISASSAVTLASQFYVLVSISDASMIAPVIQPYLVWVVVISGVRIISNNYCGCLALQLSQWIYIAIMPLNSL